jgi:hypothetical protein
MQHIIVPSLIKIDQFSALEFSISSVIIVKDYFLKLLAIPPRTLLESLSIFADDINHIPLTIHHSIVFIKKWSVIAMQILSASGIIHTLIDGYFGTSFSRANASSNASADAIMNRKSAELMNKQGENMSNLGNQLSNMQQSRNLNQNIQLATALGNSAMNYLSNTNAMNVAPSQLTDSITDVTTNVLTASVPLLSSVRVIPKNVIGIVSSAASGIYNSFFRKPSSMTIRGGNKHKRRVYKSLMKNKTRKRGNKKIKTQTRKQTKGKQIRQIKINTRRHPKVKQHKNKTRKQTKGKQNKNKKNKTRRN